MPKQIRTHCPHCNRHTVHTLSIISVSHRRRKLSRGERQKTRRARGHGGHGRFSKIPVSEMARRAKTKRKIQIKLVCAECRKAVVKSLGRMAKAEIMR